MVGRIIEEVRDDLPTGVPAIWVERRGVARLYLSPALPAGTAAAFRAMCHRTLSAA